MSRDVRNFPSLKSKEADGGLSILVIPSLSLTSASCILTLPVESAKYDVCAHPETRPVSARHSIAGVT